MKKYLFLFAITVLTLTSCATRVVTRAPSNKVVVVHRAARNHKIVVVKGHRYYFWGGKHYRKTRGGYVLVKV
jgi:hypothetical protein